MPKNIFSNLKNNFNRYKYLILLSAGVGLFILGFSISWFLSYLNYNQNREISLREYGYKLIAPLLGCGDFSKSQDSKLKKIESILNNYLNREHSDGNLIKASVYIRQIKSGNWIGINENDIYDPASLAKIPIMMSYLKMSESNPDILEKELLFIGEKNSNKIQSIKPRLSLIPNHYYNVRDLIYRMIVTSDNNAEILLLNNIDKNTLQNIYQEVSDYLNKNGVDNNGISPKSYSIFFRLLYNASYINPKLSEWAMELLSQTDFTKGIVSGVPQNIIVTQKFGERDYEDKNGKIYQVELHDCGIVYSDDNPYLLCIMTKGYDLNNLADIIKNISATTYRGLQ